MKRDISPDYCKNMFLDKMPNLSMRELGMELKHFAIGTAPECPSFLVNQEELKGLLVDKFAVFFDPDRSQGLEIIFLKGNYGNGKSHFIRTIYSFLDDFGNVLAKKVSLKQEETDLKIKILEGVGQKVIKECASVLVKLAVAESFADEKDSILLALEETFSINSILAELLYQAARSDDISIQSQAIAILKGNYLAAYLKTFKLKRADLSNEFYFHVIRLVCDFLYESNKYLVIAFDEYEHIYSWKNSRARNIFYKDVKLFTDNISIYKNLFFVFAESESGDSASVEMDDPAFASRKKVRTYQINNISSEVEVEKLFGMIKQRYEKYYEISFNKYESEVLSAINKDPHLRSKSSYRDYTQVIMRVLDQYRNNLPETRVVKEPASVDAVRSAEGIGGDAIQSSDLLLRWVNSTSISKKTMLCEALEHVLLHSDEQIIYKSKKMGIYYTEKGKDKVAYYIIATDNPKNSDLAKRYNAAMGNHTKDKIAKSIVLYPYKIGISDGLFHDNVILYDVNEIPHNLEQIYSENEHIDDVYSYLQKLKVGD